MIAFFGILQPGSGRRRRSAEAPRKRPFFGGVPLDRREHAAPERPQRHLPRTPEEEEAERRFLQLCLPPGP
jgi:hypothetical protein